MRARYEALMANPQQVEALLLQGAVKARALATPFMARLRHAVGLRPLSATMLAENGKAAKAAVASFKQYRENDGKFYFKLVDAKGQLLLQSTGFDNPKSAAQLMAQLKAEGSAALGAHAAHLQAGSASAADIDAALDSLRDASA